MDELIDPAAVVPFAPWTCCSHLPEEIAHPDQLAIDHPGWMPAPVPGTVASALHANGRWQQGQPLDVDANDWWYRTTFSGPDVHTGAPCHLCFDGLATLAEVWLNGKKILDANNMFRSYRIDVGPDLRDNNQLVLGFRSLTANLQRKRPRPRWKTNLVNDQQLRWHRTGLLGRMPGWSPPNPTVGPWRRIWLDTRPFTLADVRLHSRVEGRGGVVTFQARVHSATRPERSLLVVGDHNTPIEVEPASGHWILRAEMRLPVVSRWWPHTHGAQPLLACSLRLHLGSDRFTIPCGAVGFRQLVIEQDKGLAIHINGEPVYCRGACWTVSDILSPGGEQASLDADLRAARAAGMNMLRIGGTMIYESDRFYRLCDELGILVWQDFMFANMDYPTDDPAFAENIAAEARVQLSRLSSHPCVIMFCGNSEVEQQAAMRGAPRQTWRNDWFATQLPQLCAEYSPDAGYVPSSPCGGDLPFHVRQGVAHYYGVGAYLRSPADLRKDDVKFTSECLAFANVPEPETVNAFMGHGHPATHHPRWKERVPRDSGAGWDFEDVRDFYLHYLFDTDPVRLRSSDLSRYLQLSRVVPGEMMAQVFSEWRSAHSNNRGGLIWFYKDLWPGAGWGILDSFGVPKAAYYYLRRSWQSRQITLTNEGLDGLHLHLINETFEPLSGHVELLLLKDGHITVARREVFCSLPARGQQTFDSDALLDGFQDVTYCYRFGPPGHDVAIATLFDDQRNVLSEAYHFVQRRQPTVTTATLDAVAERTIAGGYLVTLRSDRFLHSVSFDAQGYRPEDNYFHLVPGRAKTVHLTACGEQTNRFRGYVQALNLANPATIRIKETV
jgi:beta-mannosidase